jgi:hypothetical protein
MLTVLQVVYKALHQLGVLKDLTHLTRVELLLTTLLQVS